MTKQRLLSQLPGGSGSSNADGPARAVLPEPSRRDGRDGQRQRGSIFSPRETRSARGGQHLRKV